MGSLYVHRLSAGEHKALIAKLHEQQLGKCYICGKPIDLIVHDGQIEVDHVEPTKVGGKDGPDNFALTHATCNRTKLASDLRVARILCRFDDLARAIESENRAPNLGDVLREYGGAKHELKIQVNGCILRTSFAGSGRPEVVEVPVYEDKLSGFRSAFANLPIEYIHHDNLMNPRGIGTNLRKLIEEFHKRRPQLHVALGWIDNAGDTRVRIFDGQHKAAAQILLGAKSLPVRVFIDPDKDVLLTTNTHAGTTLRQVAFDKSVQRRLGSRLLADRMDRFRADRGLDEDNEMFSERELVSHFKGEPREVKRYVLDWVRNSITTHESNNLRDFVDYGGRGTQLPLSYSTVEKTFYSFFIYGDLLTTPFNFRVEEGRNPRRLEIENNVRLMNLITEKIFADGRFDPSRGTRRIENDIQKGKDVPEPHLRAFRMSKEEVIYNWLKHVRKVVYQYFVFGEGKPINENKLFQYEIPESVWTNVDNFLSSLIRLPMWGNRELSNTVFGGKQNYEFWETVFETGQTPTGIHVMPQGLNLKDMVTG